MVNIMTSKKLYALLVCLILVIMVVIPLMEMMRGFRIRDALDL